MSVYQIFAKVSKPRAIRSGRDLPRLTSPVRARAGWRCRIRSRRRACGL